MVSVLNLVVGLFEQGKVFFQITFLYMFCPKKRINFQVFRFNFRNETKFFPSQQVKMELHFRIAISFSHLSFSQK